MSFTAPRRTLRRHRLAQAGTLSAALMLMLTACGGDSEPAESTSTAPPTTVQPAAESSTADPDPSKSESATPSDASTENAEGTGGEYVPASADGPAKNVPKPQMPTEMKEETKEGAEAAVRYFWDVHYYAEQTGDTELFDSLYSEYCEFCAARSHSINGIYRDGIWYTGTQPRIDSISTLPSPTGMVSTLLVSSDIGHTYSETNKTEPLETVNSVSKSPWVSESHFDANEKTWIIDEMRHEGSGSNQ